MPQQQPASYQGSEMMMKSVFWWRKQEYPEETGKYGDPQNIGKYKASRIPEERKKERKKKRKKERKNKRPDGLHSSAESLQKFANK